MCVKANSNSLTDNFKSSVGVRQGDNLTPNLFKLFVNDLPDIFDSNCMPVSLNISKINCLMYTDDVILLSEAPAGLQNSLSHLQTYCTKWGLEVNIKKPKSLIFNNTGKLDTNIENVRHYSYLGVNFSITGSFTEVRGKECII